jgi:hypothetical protein
MVETARSAREARRSLPSFERPTSKPDVARLRWGGGAVWIPWEHRNR